MGMMVGVAVGWALAEELDEPNDPKRRTESDGDQTSLATRTFELSEGDSRRVLVDPFLKPNNPVAPRDRRRARADAHPDHPRPRRPRGGRGRRREADGRALRRDRRARQLAREQGVETVSDPNLGGTVEFDWGWVKLVQAFHTGTLVRDAFSAETVGSGQAGLVIKIGGTTVYHLGDTCLFGDLKLIAERTPVDVALIPIGGHYTMDRHDAVVAAELIGAGR